MRIAEIKIGKRIRKDIGELGELCESIDKIGLLHPIVVTPDNRLISGVRRVAAFKKLKREVIPHRVVASLADAVSLLIAERDENTCRKDFTGTEKVAFAENKLMGLERAKAKERQLSGKDTSGQAGGRGKKKPSPNLGEGLKHAGETTRKVAAALGVSGYTLEKMQRVVKAAREDPEMFGDLPAIMDESGNVDKTYKQIKQREKARLAEEIRNEPPPIKKEGIRYGVIVVDPPWQYEKRKEDTTHRARLLYPTMTTEEICVWGKNLPTEKDCLLWLWTTNAFMRDAYTVLDAWGFAEKTILTWVKHKMGVGDWLRGKTEHCILAVKGKPIVTLTNQTTVLEAPVREHSQKPDEFFAMVDVLCPSRNRAEYFAREERLGWNTYGAESK